MNLKKIKYNEIIKKRLDNSSDIGLEYVYYSWSNRKENAFNYCKKLQGELNGTHGRILSYNKNEFTFGFYFKDSDGNLCVAYITRLYNRYFIVE